MWRFKIINSDRRSWQWRTNRAPSGFWIKYRGPFMWWGKDGKRTESKVSYSHDYTSYV